jgi:hypothetical protein
MTKILFEPHGVIPACLMPFDCELRIDISAPPMPRSQGSRCSSRRDAGDSRIVVRANGGLALDVMSYEAVGSSSARKPVFSLVPSLGRLAHFGRA